jgi:hypothetical protein
MSANRADTYLLYGDTGTGKTAQIGELAKWEFARTGRITRLISADSGWDPIEHLIGPGGCIQAYDMQYVPNPFAVITKLSEGEWPIVKDGKPVMVRSSPGELAKIGQYAIEGITTLAEILLANHASNARQLSQDVAYKYRDRVDEEVNGKVQSTEITFANVAMSHYGDVQNRVLYDIVPRFAALPVDRVIWTGHEARGDDQTSGIKKSILGPGTAGTAAVGRTVRKFGETFHLVKVEGRGGGIERRAYYEDHPDDTLKAKLWPANTRVSLEEVAGLHKKFQGGFVPLTPEAGLNKYFDYKYGEKK